MRLPLLPLLSILLLSGSLSLVGWAAEGELVWQERFNQGMGSAAKYRGGESVEIMTEPEGAFLKVQVSGKTALEGVRIPMKPIAGNRLLVVTARMRGQGTWGPMISAVNGWTRLPQITLNDQWQTVEIPKTLKAGTDDPTLYFVTMPKDVPQPGAVLELADLEARLAPPLPLSAQEVTTQRYEAEEYNANPSLIKVEEGQTIVETSQPYASQEFPFPQTNQPLTLYIHYRAVLGDERVQVCTRRGGVKQAIREIVPPDAGWQWLTVGDLSAEEVGDGFSIEVWPPKGSANPAALDAIVLSVDPNLDPASF